jgi:putative restriction endonuclease
VGSEERTDFVIGCRILTQPFFLQESEWFEPPSWPPHFQGFKTYSTDDPDGLMLWETAYPHFHPGAAYRFSSPQGASDVSHARWGEPTLIQPRLGQGAFRIVVTDNYARRCAVTGERTPQLWTPPIFARMPIMASMNRGTGYFFAETSTACSIEAT